MITTADDERVEELLREARALVYWLGPCHEQFGLLTDVLDRHTDAIRRNEPEASLDVSEAFSDASSVLREVSEAFAVFDKRFLDHVNKLYDEAERRGL